MDAADGRARRRAALVVLVGTAIGAGVIALTRHLMPALTLARAPLILLLLGVFAVVPVLALAVYLWRLGARALEEERFPPVGTAMIRAEPVRTGALARRQARLVQAFAALLGAAGLALAAVLWRLSNLLRHG